MAAARNRGGYEWNAPCSLSRFHLVIDIIDGVPQLRAKAAHLKEQMKNDILDNMRYAHEQGTDRPELANWTWPY